MIFLLSTLKIQGEKKTQKNYTKKLYIQKLKYSYTVLKTRIY